MAAYRRVYDSRHLRTDCHEPGSAPEPYARYSSMGYVYVFFPRWKIFVKGRFQVESKNPKGVVDSASDDSTENIALEAEISLYSQRKVYREQNKINNSYNFTILF